MDLKDLELKWELFPEEVYSTVNKHVHVVVQDMYATYILEKSLRK